MATGHLTTAEQSSIQISHEPHYDKSGRLKLMEQALFYEIVLNYLSFEPDNVNHVPLEYSYSLNRHLTFMIIPVWDEMIHKWQILVEISG